MFLEHERHSIDFLFFVLRCIVREQITGAVHSTKNSQVKPIRGKLPIWPALHAGFCSIKRLVWSIQFTFQEFSGANSTVISGIFDKDDDPAMEGFHSIKTTETGTNGKDTSGESFHKLQDV